MRESWWRWARPLGGAAILVLLLAQLGAAPVRDALQALDARALVVGAVIALATTACSAWRWRLVAERLRIELPMSRAVAAYYRSLFLNLTLPGGVLGDVDRGVQHGREVADVHRALRAVAWERACGQLVLVTLAVLAAFSTAFVGPALLLGAAAVAVAALLLPLTVRAARTGGRSVLSRLSGVVVADGRSLLSAPAVLGILVSSVVAIGGHAATFVVAARTVGVAMPVGELVVAAVLVLLLAAVPLSLAGWGLREGAAAGVFVAVGAEASEGLAVSVAYGAMVLVGALPGLVVVLAGRRARAAEVTAGA